VISFKSVKTKVSYFLLAMIDSFHRKVPNS